MGQDSIQAGLHGNDFPALHQQTDRAAKGYQRTFLYTVAFESVLIIAGAVTLVLTPKDSTLATVSIFGHDVGALPLATALSLLLAVVPLLTHYILKPGEKWRQSRFVGESCKSLAWRYAVKATAFDINPGLTRVASLREWYTGAFDDLIQQAKDLDLADTGSPSAITDKMKNLREATLTERFKAYIDQRARDQRDWYQRKAKVFRGQRTFWRTVRLVVYVVGAGLVAAYAFKALPFNFWPLAAATLSAVAGYVAARHYDDLLQSYWYMGERLTAEIDGMSSFGDNEAEFAQWVAHVEGLMDAEHQQWHSLT
jgi:hypothetical protein